MTEAGLNLPPHVPQHLIVDFDYFHPPGADQDVHLVWKRVQETAPRIFWTPRNGGHWVATRAEDIKAIYTDWQRFSNKNYLIPKHPNPYRSLPTGVDPPEHTTYRGVLMPAFVPAAIVELEETAREIAISLTETLKPRGECEFVSEFSRILPIVVFLKMAGLPEKERFTLLPWVDEITRGETFEARQAGYQKMAAYVEGWVNDRRANPRADLISRMVNAQVFGRTMLHEEAMGMCVQVLFGGLDTVASMLSFTARFLAQNPGHRRRLIEDPTIMRTAIEELIRRHGLANTGRMVAEDLDYNGAPLRKGDMIQLPNVLYGLDEALVENPTEVDFDREWPIPHATFGIGAHVCPGAVLARREMKVFLEEWLRRIPDFQIKPGTRPVTASGIVNGVLSLELSWDPGQQSRVA